MEKNKIHFMMALLAIFIISFLALPNQVDAINLHVTNATNNTLAFTVLSGGNFTINVTTSNQTNPQTGNGGHAANVTIYRLCERNTAPTVIASRLNTSANQTTFSFGVNTTAIEDCNMTIMARAFNDTAGGVIIHVGGESNTSDVYFNSSVLVVSLVTVQDDIQKSSNGSITFTLTTDEQASNVTYTINNRRITMIRTNSSGMRWQGSAVDLPYGTYTVTVNARDLANDLITSSRRVELRAFGADGITTLAKVGALNPTVTTGLGGAGGFSIATLTSQKINIGNFQVPVILIIAVIVIIVLARRK